MNAFFILNDPPHDLDAGIVPGARRGTMDARATATMAAGKVPAF